MAVYEDSEITAELINGKFPTVASAIIAQAQGDAPEITAELITEKYPGIAAAFRQEGKEEGVLEGATAEQERLASIDAVDTSLYDAAQAAAIVAEAKEDGKSTANDVKLKLFDLGVNSKESMASARAEDGATLAALAAEAGNGEVPDKGASEKEKAVQLMAEAAKKA